MAVSLVGTGGAQALSTSRSPAVTLSGYAPAVGDYVFLFVATMNPAVVILPAGWSNVLPGTNVVATSFHQLSVVYHVVTSADVSAATTTYTATNLFGAGLLGYVHGCAARGVDAIDAVGTKNVASSVTPHYLAALDASAVTRNNSLLIRCMARDGSNGYGANPSGHTQIQSTNVNQTLVSFRRTALTTAGVAVAETAMTPGSNDRYVSITLALAEPVPVPQGTAGSGYAWAGAAAGRRAPHGASDGGYTWASSAAGHAPITGPAEGGTVGGYAWDAVAVGRIERLGSAGGGYHWAGDTAGVTVSKGHGLSQYTWQATVVGLTPPMPGVDPEVQRVLQFLGVPDGDTNLLEWRSSEWLTSMSRT